MSSSPTTTTTNINDKSTLFTSTPLITTTNTATPYSPLAPNNKSSQEQQHHSIIDTHLSSSFHRSTYLSSLPYQLIIFSLAIAQSSDAVEILCLSYIIANPSFQENILKGNVTVAGGGTLAASVFAGMFFGGLYAGFKGDVISEGGGWGGRMGLLVRSLVLNCTAGVASCLVGNVWVLCGLRMVCGLGIGMTIPPLFALVTELSPPEKRGTIITIVASFWMMGSLYVALMGLIIFEWTVSTPGGGENTWRLFALVCALPSGVGAAMVQWNVPESPRVLALNGRYDDAATIVNQISLALTGSTHPLPPISAHDIRTGHHHHPHHTPPSFLTTMSQLYTIDPSIRRTSLALQFLWSSLAFGSYGLLTWINTIFEEIGIKDIYVNAFIFAAASLPGNIISALLLDIVGRRILLCSSLLLSAVSLFFFAMTVLGAAMSTSTSPSINNFAVIFSAGAFQAFSTCAWNTIDCYTCELFPTRVRSAGMGICTASARVGAMIAQFVNGALVHGGVGALLGVSGVVLGVGAVMPICFLREEMKGRDVADEFEGDGGGWGVKERLSDGVEGDEEMVGEEIGEVC